MFNEEANIAGAIQAYFNKQVESLEEASILYKIDLKILESFLSPSAVQHENIPLDEVLPDVN